MPEKSQKYKIIFAFCFIAFMLAFGCSSVVAYINNNSTNSTEQVQQNVAEEEQTEVKQNLVDRYWDIANKLTESMEKYTSENSYLSHSIRGIVKEVDRMLGNDVILNGSQPFVRLSNGYYTYVFPYSHPENEWNGILDFSTRLAERHIEFFTVIPANKSDDSVTRFSPGVPHGYSKMEEEYRNFLDKNSLSYLNAKDILLSENDNLYDWFYKTDHHWNVHAGRLVAEKIAETLNNEFNLEADADAVRESNFDLVCYPESYIASMGKKDGADKEDFEVFYPKEQGLFRVRIPEIGLDKTGTFADAIIDGTYLSEDSDYLAFLYGVYGLTRVENKTCENNTRVLMIGKSNQIIVCPYLAFSVRYIDIIDTRYYDGSILSFIGQTNPDIVITLAGIPEDNEEDAEFWQFN